MCEMQSAWSFSGLHGWLGLRSIYSQRGGKTACAFFNAACIAAGSLQGGFALCTCTASQLLGSVAKAQPGREFGNLANLVRSVITVSVLIARALALPKAPLEYLAAPIDASQCPRIC